MRIYLKHSLVFSMNIHWTILNTVEFYFCWFVFFRNSEDLALAWCKILSFRIIGINSFLHLLAKCQKLRQIVSKDSNHLLDSWQQFCHPRVILSSPTTFSDSLMSALRKIFTWIFFKTFQTIIELRRIFIMINSAVVWVIKQIFPGSEPMLW